MFAGRFSCPCCGAAECRVYDARPLTWRHLDFWEHTTYLNARVPRVRCDACGVKKARVPWAREGSGFTLLFEDHVMKLVRDMPVAPAARMVREHDTRLWGIIRHYVDDARAADDHSGLCRAAFDETSANGEEAFVSLFVDLDLNPGLAPAKINSALSAAYRHLFVRVALQSRHAGPRGAFFGASHVIGRVASGCQGPCADYGTTEEIPERLLEKSKHQCLIVTGRFPESLKMG